METIKNLLTRYSRTGVLFLGGLLLIMYIGLGFLYMQQGAQQKELEKEITRLSAVVSKPLPSGEELQTEYEEVNLALAPMSDEDAIAWLVSIAEVSGIDTDPAAEKFRVPPAQISKTKLGASTYQLVSFTNIHVQGDHDNVTAFLSDLDSGKTKATITLKRVTISETSFTPTGEEAARRAEFRKVESAVTEMMHDTGLSRIPNPMSFSGGVAANLMGDDPDTEGRTEGFPDITTTAGEKGYTGSDSPRGGYVLYKHDKISTDNTTQFKTTSYIDTLTTEYYYTCEADGTIRQFSRVNVDMAIEYLGSEVSKTETVASLNVNIYTKP